MANKSKFQTLRDDVSESNVKKMMNVEYSTPLEKPFGDSHTISADSYIEYCINCFALNKFVQTINTDKRSIGKKSVKQFEYDYDKYSEIYLEEEIIFIYKEKIHFIIKNAQSLSINIDGKHSNELFNMIMTYIRENNVLRNKQVFITQDSSGLNYKLKKPTNITFKDVVMDGKIKQDIQDNIVYHLQHIDGSNGVIFHGPPGTGKSLSCSASINEVLHAGFSACYVTTEVDFDKLKDFLNKMLAPCLFIFEDMDSMGQSRKDTINTRISSLLQFLNGLSDEEDKKYAYIATTNYLEHLDEALANRPARFNRKYKFDYPTDNEIDQLIDIKFKGLDITDENKALCYNKGFTGSHIQELKRTCDTQVKKYGLTYNDALQKSVEIIDLNFKQPKRSAGFKMD